MSDTGRKEYALRSKTKKKNWPKLHYGTTQWYNVSQLNWAAPRKEITYLDNIITGANNYFNPLEDHEKKAHEPDTEKQSKEAKKRKEDIEKK